MTIEITTNNHPRDLLSFHDASAHKTFMPEWFDYLDDADKWSLRFVWYRGEWYDVGDFQRCDTSALKSWDGYAIDSLGTGVVVRYADEYGETVVMGNCLW